MPTDNERRALWFLAIVALSGSVVRLVRSRQPERSPDAGLERQLARVDSARANRSQRAAPSAGRRPKAESPKPRAESPKPRAESPKPRAERGEPRADAQLIDIDRARAEELEELPGIGPALAARIVANRDSLGAFGSAEALCRVRGIGKVLVERLRPLVEASGFSEGVSAACGGASTAAGKVRAPRHAKQP